MDNKHNEQIKQNEKTKPNTVFDPPHIPDQSTLRDYQAECIKAIEEKESGSYLIVLPTGSGKCFAPGTQILMYDGSIKNVEDIKENDFVMGPDSKPRQVIGLAHGSEMMYKITPTKGDSYTVNESHILSLRATENKSATLDNHGNQFFSGDICNISVKDYLQCSKTFKHCMKGYRTGIEFPYQNLPLDPYLFGIWLGDRTSIFPYITIADKDVEIIEYVKQFCNEKGLKLNIKDFNPTENAKLYRISSKSRKHNTNPINNILNNYNLKGNKHIPDIYLKNDYYNRIQLLAGLLDSDGCYNKGYYEICTVSEQLKENILFLTRSLGFAVYSNDKIVNNKIYYRISISGELDNIPCKVHRKQAIPRKQKKNVLNVGITVESIGIGEYYGFELFGPDRLFLLADFTVVHNTFVFSHIPRHGRVLILSHRDELVHQPEKYYDCSFGVEQAKEKSNGEEVVSASVQSMVRRLKRFDPYDFDMIITDEAHHAVAPSYRKIYDYFKPRIHLGFTATPDRADRADLNKIYGEVLFYRDIKWGINQKYLTDINCLRVNVGYDLSKARKQMGDFNIQDLGKEMLNQACVDAVAQAYKDYHKGQTLIFCANVEHCNMVSKKIPGSMVVTADTPNRDEIIKRFTNREIECLLNCMVFCLDEQTEILTDHGFIRMDDMSYQYKIANWNPDGTVFFDYPQNIIKRPLDESESMISVESRTINFRVTNTHQMLERKQYTSEFVKIDAENISSLSVFPTNGIAEPFSFNIFKDVDYTPNSRDIARMKWDMVHKQGYDPSDPKTREEAIRRLKRSKTRRHLNPSELSLDLCKFIGFWIADGSKNKLIRKGSEYILCQSTAYPNIIEWIDNVLNNTGIHYLKKLKKRKNITPFYIYSLPRGTGGGSQEREGIFPVEPYLDKNGNELFWGLNERQFDAVLEGYWYGDGYHGQAENGFNSPIQFADTNKQWIDLLCAIGSVRGWRCAVHKYKPRKENHNPLYRMWMKKSADAWMSDKTIIKNEPYDKNNIENVWCVSSTSGNIITRRNGYVLVTGNCEGTDMPLIETVIIARPTHNQSLYVQQVGRGLRPYPGKDALTLIDCVGASKMSVCTAPTLFGLNAEVIPKSKQGKIVGKLTEMEEIIDNILDEPDSWIDSIEKIALFEEDNTVDTLGINCIPMGDDSLHIPIGNNRTIVIPPTDALGKTCAYVEDYSNNEIKKSKSLMVDNLQTILNKVYTYLMNKCQNSRALWDLNYVSNRWGNQPASAGQLKYIISLAMMTKTKLDCIEPYTLNKQQASILIERMKSLPIIVHQVPTISDDLLNKILKASEKRVSQKEFVEHFQFCIGQKIKHPFCGQGTITDIVFNDSNDDATITVTFDDNLVTTYSYQKVLKNGSLEKIR